MNEEELRSAEFAGEEVVRGATSNMPAEENKTCEHNFETNKTVLKKKTLFGYEEMLTAVIFCKKCGRLGGSSRIKF